MVFTLSFQSHYQRVGGSRPASGNLVLSFSLSSSGCSDHLPTTPPVDSAVNEYLGIYSWGQSNWQFPHISCGPGGTSGAHTTC